MHSNTTMTTKTTKTTYNNETQFAWNDGFWVQEEGPVLTEYYDEDKMRLLLNRLNRGAEMMGFGLKNTNGKTMYMPRHFACVRMKHYTFDGKKWSHNTHKRDKDGFDAYFVAEYGTHMWVQKTGENIGKLTDNDELQLIKKLAKLTGYDNGAGVKNRRGR